MDLSTARLPGTERLQAASWRWAVKVTRVSPSPRVMFEEGRDGHGPSCKQRADTARSLLAEHAPDMPTLPAVRSPREVADEGSDTGRA
jgi:hypothetical protein